ncbi:hypothetical protein OF83DRAFT_102686 [Amylostereum chailletii]|nr:hypothetical protein OF83DRAFT_102686 [Amylostereum chailletii]
MTVAVVSQCQSQPLEPHAGHCHAHAGALYDQHHPTLCAMPTPPVKLNKEYCRQARLHHLTATSMHRYDPNEDDYVHKMCIREIADPEGFVKYLDYVAGARYPLLVQAAKNCKPSRAKNKADCKCPGQVMAMRLAMLNWIDYHADYYRQPPVYVCDPVEQGTYELVQYFLDRTAFMTQRTEEERCHAAYGQQIINVVDHPRNYCHGIMGGFYGPRPPPAPRPLAAPPVESKPLVSPPPSGQHHSFAKAEPAGDHKPYPHHGVDRKPTVPSVYPASYSPSSTSVKQEAYAPWDDRKPVIPSSPHAPRSATTVSQPSYPGSHAPRSRTTSSFVKQEPLDGHMYPASYATEDRKPVLPPTPHSGRTASTARFAPYSPASSSRTSRASRPVQVKPEPVD